MAVDPRFGAMVELARRTGHIINAGRAAIVAFRNDYIQ